MAYQTPFMKFWEELNAVLANHNLPEMLYGEARAIWKRGSEWTTDSTGLIDTHRDTGEMRA